VTRKLILPKEYAIYSSSGESEYTLLHRQQSPRGSRHQGFRSYFIVTCIFVYCRLPYFQLEAGFLLIIICTLLLVSFKLIWPWNLETAVLVENRNSSHYFKELYIFLSTICLYGFWSSSLVWNHNIDELFSSHTVILRMLCVCSITSSTECQFVRWGLQCARALLSVSLIRDTTVSPDQVRRE
jgi:hypothetical protein